MKLRTFIVDAFSDRTLSGNPAGVCPLDQWLPVQVMQSIASELNQSETVFFVPRANARNRAEHAEFGSAVVGEHHEDVDEQEDAGDHGKHAHGEVELGQRRGRGLGVDEKVLFDGPYRRSRVAVELFDCCSCGFGFVSAVLDSSFC